MRHLAPLVVVLAACSPEPAQEPPERPSSYVAVIDGATLLIRDERVRLANVDAPSLPPQAACSAEAALAVQSAKQAREFIALASSIQLQRDGVDEEGQTLARVLLNGDNDLGEALVFAGVAAEWGREPWDWCGTTGFERAGGPSFVNGPHANEAFVGWVTDRVAADATGALTRTR